MLVVELRLRQSCGREEDEEEEEKCGGENRSDDHICARLKSEECDSIFPKETTSLTTRLRDE